MISGKDKKKIIRIAKKYRVTSVHLFGSSLYSPSANDIDLGVKGINPKLFFELYGELLTALSKPIDLVDLSMKSLFNSIIEKNSVKIYG